MVWYVRVNRQSPRIGLYAEFGRNRELRVKNLRMVGDTDPPRIPVLLGFQPQNSRTCLIDLKREFSATPAPGQGTPPPSEMRTPAKAATMAGANSRYKVGQARKYISERTNATLTFADAGRELSTCLNGRNFRDVAADLRQTAREIYRIHDPMRSNPERVHASKDELAKRLEALAREVEAL